jgi:hypothetical protein
MSNITKTCAGIFLFLSFIASARSQWSPTPSGTTNDLRGVYLLDSGVAYAVGDAGTILKSTDAGTTWNALVSGTANALYDIYIFRCGGGRRRGDSTHDGWRHDLGNRCQRSKR